VTTFLIDVSMWQGGSLNWAEIDAANIDGAIAKVSQGTTIDPDWAINRKGMLSTTLVPGGYSWLSPGVDATAAVKAYLAAIGDPYQFLCALDCEQPGITVAGIKAWAAAFKASVPDHPLFIYIGRNVLASLGHPDLHALGPWWEPYYPGGGSYPGDTSAVWTTGLGGWAGPTIWQYTSSGTVPTAHPVDTDAYRGTPATLATYKGVAPMRLPYLPSSPIGSATVLGTGAAAFDADGKATRLTQGQVLPIYGSGTLLHPINSANATNLLVYITVIGSASAYVLQNNVAYAPSPDATPFSQADVNASYDAGIDATVKQAGTTPRK
jgi:hypothetical protein